MKDLLAPENREVLLQFASSNVLLTFDYDGTLAPIVANRDHAAMRSTTRQLLTQVASLYPCAVISGRSVTDLERYIEGIPLQYVVGNHGLEPSERMGEFAQLAAEIRTQVEPMLAHVQGVELEDKQYSLAIHYRRSRRRLWAREEVVRAISCITVPVRTIAGKLVLNIVPEQAPHKGTALLTLRAKQGADAAIYVGDDDTDEDVFETDQPRTILGVRVGRSHRSAAPFYIRNQARVDDLLALLASTRQACVTPIPSGNARASNPAGPDATA